MSLTRKSFILLLFIFNIAYIQSDVLPTNGAKFDISGNKTLHIQLDESQYTYQDYIGIILYKEKPPNPLIYVAKDEQCNDRFFAGVQMVDAIFTFFKKTIGMREFYICTIERQNSQLTEYQIQIMSMNKVTIPLDIQASYYVYDESIQRMSFDFNPKGVEGHPEITYWVKGKTITYATMGASNSIPIDNGYYFHDDYYTSGTPELTVTAKVGDYITIGSTLVTEKKARELKENANEMVVASNHEVCFPVKATSELAFITGKIYTKRAKTYFTDQNGKILEVAGEKYERNITDGMINDINLIRMSDIENGYYCVENLDSQSIVFSVQMRKDQTNPAQVFLPPLLPGEIQRHYLLNGQMAIFYGSKPNDGALEVNFNIKAYRGFPQMYQVDCDTFPNCHYTKDSIYGLKFLYPSNLVSTYSYYISELKESNQNYNPISSYQPLIIVYCSKGGKEEEFYGEDFFCEFETTYFTDQDTIKLYEGCSFSQFLYYDEQDKYIINLKNDDINSIYLDLLIFSGDADISLPNDFTSGTANKYYLSNKIFYSIRFMLGKPESLEFSINATEKTFYMVQYKLFKRDMNTINDDTNILDSGINYITSKAYGGVFDRNPKHLQFLNYKYEFNQPYLVTLYSPNCIFDVELEKNGTRDRIGHDTNEIQQIINPRYNYYNDKFDFYYTIKEDDNSIYNNRICMVYAAGLELSNSSEEWNERTISLSEGVPHRYTFSRFYPFIAYSYHVSDPRNKLVINFNLIDKDYFDITININGKFLQKDNIYRNSQIFVTKNDLDVNCESFEACTVNVRLRMRGFGRARTVEITMYQIDKTPFYLEKNVVKQDILIGLKPKHYYFDIGSDEYGDITLDFKRGSGNIFASVEPRNLNKAMDDPEWRGKYHFPEFIHESIKYDTYGKKILITEDSTKNCTGGCYVLITIQSNIIIHGVTEESEEVPFRISINPRIVKKDSNYPSPKVRIGVNDFIFGNIMYGLPENRKYDYYSLILPFESEQILIDWQADSPSLIINVGNLRPTKDDADFSFPPIGKDCIYILNRTDILEKGGYNNNTFMRSLELTIGIYTDVSDSITSSPYAFKILMPPSMPHRRPRPRPSDGSSDEPPRPPPSDGPRPPGPFPLGPVMHMIHIRSDQKVQCLPFIYENTYTCLFAVIVDDMDLDSNIIIYARSQNGYPVTIYGKKVNAEEIERNNGTIIMQHIEEVFKKDNCKESQSYVNIPNVKKTESYFFMTTADTSGNIIEILSSSFRYYNDMILYPNPSTAQIFSLDEYHINFKFSTTRDLLINIVCVSGNGSFYWENDQNKKLYLSGPNDRLSLTTYTEIVYDRLNSLKINPGNNFIFVITYYPRSNIDQLKREQNTELHYRAVRMPLNYFAPITLASDWTINFNFYEIGLKDNSNLIYDTNLFTIKATIISEETAQKARFDPQSRPNCDNYCVSGIYDSSFGHLYIDKDYVDTVMTNQKIVGVPNVFFIIEKNPNIRADFSTMDMEISLYSNFKLDIQKDIFISGKLSNSNEKKYTYHLNIEEGKRTLVIQFAANSDSTQFELKPDDNKRNYGVDTKEMNGYSQTTVTFNERVSGINLIIFNNNNNLDDRLSYFIFRYTFNTFQDNFTPSSKALTVVTNDNNNYQIKFYPIQNDGTTYFIKAYYKEGFINGEKIDTIAMSESPGAYMQINNVSYSGDSQLSYNLITEKKVNYIKVMAITMKDDQKYYYLYETEYVYKELTPNYLEPIQGMSLNGNGNSTFRIQFQENKDNYGKYIGIILDRNNNINPLIYVGKDEDCTERIFTGVQLVDNIYIFFKKDQIDNEFYICTKERQNINENTNLPNYEIKIVDMDEVNLPCDNQASYYISDESIKDMVFSFNKSGVPDNLEVTFWVKGKNIASASMSGLTELDKKQIDNGYVFYGTLNNKIPQLTVKSNTGDYITIGSTVLYEGKKTKELKLNANEMTVASNDKVCLPIKGTNGLSFITGKIYTKRATTYFMENRETFSKTNIINGMIIDINAIKVSEEDQTFYCLEPYNNDLIIFSIQVTSDNADPTHVFLPPLLPGEIKRHILLKGQMAVFYGMKPNDDAYEVNFNIKSLKGFPEMYYDHCNTFPYCHYTKDLIQKLDHLYPSNMVTTYSFYRDEVMSYNPISVTQPLMIVYCNEGGKKESFGEDYFCEFETTYFTNQDTIKLYQDTSFSQYLYSKEEDKYLINLENDNNINLIHLDLLLFSGDADIILPYFEGDANKYYLSNKIFYSIHFNKGKPDNLEFRIKATNKTFYMVQYKLLESETTVDFNTLESGINYIISKDYNPAVLQTEKHLQFLNFKYEFSQAYLVTFYSPNCLFDIYWDKKSDKERIENDTDVTQRVIDPRQGDYYAEIFDFYYKIKADDNSQYPKKFCMIYASGLELSNSTEQWNGRSISLSEGVPHTYIFNKDYPLIIYSYHVSDTSNNLILNFNLIDKEYFDVNVDINGVKDVVITTVYRSGQIVIKQKEFAGRCVELEICTVDVKIRMRSSRRGRKLEFTMYQLDKTPFYLQKNVVKQDILNGNKPKHYYFDITNEETGDITLDFKRGSGKIFASIQKRKLDKPMDQPEWRGMYRFPMTIDESLKYDIYGKKIIIYDDSVKHCSDGCYVLITIFSSVRYYGVMDDEVTPFRISINPKIVRKDSYYPSPRVRINVNDFIIGNIMYGLPENRKYDYYSLILPYESEQIIIDWQADSPSIIINVGDVRPTKDRCHFSFPQLDKDYVYIINKTDIIKKGNLDDNSNIRYLELTIGIYSDYSDSISFSPYAFKIYMPAAIEGPPPPPDDPRPSDRPSDQPPLPPPDLDPMKAVMNIIHIRSDQKVQCFPFIFEGTNTCLFAVIVDDMDIRSSIVVYPRSQDGSPVKIYGKLVNSEEVEKNNGRVIMGHFRDVFKNDDYIQQKYVYIKNVAKTEAFFFVVTQDDTKDIIEVLSSSFFIYHDDMSYTPNPSSPQIYAIKEFKINLNFWTTKDFLINIVSISGRGKFYWGDEPNKQYYLDGFEDRVSLTTYTDEEEKKLSLLKAESLNDEEYDFLEGGFIFYITYYPRSNVDQLKKDRTLEFDYRVAKMPLNYYIPITFGNDWTINLDFYDLSTKGNKKLEYDTNLFTIWATIISQDKARDIRFNYRNIPSYQSSSCYKGIYDSTFGTIHISKEEIFEFSKKENINEPNIFFTIDKNTNVKEEFSTLGLEINVYSNSEVSSGKPIQEGVYITGKLSYSTDNKLKYLLQLDKNNMYLAIQYSANSDSIRFALSTDPNKETNDEIADMQIKEMRGYNLILLKFDEKKFPDNGIYFIVFTKDNNLNKKLDYFTFVYYLSFNELVFPTFLDQDETELTITSSGNNYTINFHKCPIDTTTYYIKAYYKNGFIDGEKKETIAISESPSKNIQIEEINVDENKKVTYKFTTDEEVTYIKVLARINLNEIKVYYLYSPYTPKPENEEPKEEEKQSDKTLIYVCIGIGSVLLVVAIVLFVFFFLYKNRNRNLLEQVNKISFAESGAKEKEDNSNLLINDDEESLA